jgi:hypothetical protein
MRSVKFLGLAAVLMLCGVANAEGVKFDTSKVVGSEACAECHTAETAAWKKTPHFATWDTLHKKDTAKAIAEKMGVKSIKRGDLCLKCHYTAQGEGAEAKAVSGVSCESCHGPAKDWIKVHNNFGGADVKKETEPPAHAAARIKDAMDHGMLHPSNIYLVAQNCLNCHTVPNEQLVNTGGHNAGSADFELVAWSQGVNRHNYMRTAGKTNAEEKPEALRVMYVVGQLADLEYSTRAVAKATEKADYGITMAKRAKKVLTRLEEVQAKAPIEQVAAAIEAIKAVKLKLNNDAELTGAADKVGAAAKDFAMKADGSKLAALDEFVPKPAEYKGAPSP